MAFGVIWKKNSRWMAFGSFLFSLKKLKLLFILLFNI